MKNKKFWRLKNSVEGSGSKLYIDGVISEESWWGDEATPQQLRQELQQVTGNSLEVVLNSPGGDVWAGVAMHDALKELDAEVTIKVSGLAASIASVIAMAGDKIVITPGSTMMIHKASMLAMGTADDLNKAIEMLETCEEGIVSIYADRTGQSTEDIQTMMNDETWMSAEKAVELGFADAVVKPESDEEEVPQNLFGGNFAFSMKATKEALDSFLSKAKNESEETSEKGKEDDDSQTPEPDAPAPEEEPEAPEAEEVTDPKPEEKETKPVEKEIENMTEAEKIAAAQVISPENQAKPDEKPKVKNYLKTMASVEDFAKILKANAGKTVEDVRGSWKDMLVKNGLSDADYFQLPEPIITSINDAVKTSGIYSLLNKTGLDVWKTVWDSTDANADTSRAGGHSKGDTKTQQTLAFDKRTIRPGVIYKYLVLDKETIREQRSTGALVKFVLNELPTRIIREIERAVLIGDGRDSDADRKITSFISVKADVVAGNSFASSYVPSSTETHVESVTRAKDMILAEGTVVMIAKKGYATDAKFEKDSDNRFLFPLGTKATDIFDIDTIIEPTWFTDSTDADYDAYLVVFSDYKTVGDNSVEAFTNFKLETNENEFLQEIYQGGGLDSLKSAVGIASATS